MNLAAIIRAENRRRGLAEEIYQQLMDDGWDWLDACETAEREANERIAAMEDDRADRLREECGTQPTKGEG